MCKVLNPTKGRFLLLSCLWFSLFYTNTSWCQINIKITDGASGLPLGEVEVLDENFSQILLTDAKGSVKIDTSSSKVFHFNKQGYSSQSLSLYDIIRNENIVELNTVSKILDELILIAQTSIKETDQYHQIQKIKARDIQIANVQTSADALSSQGGVYIQKSQMGGGSPIIRGFEANRVLLVVDGVRMNNAIYRNGHLHNAISIDPSIIEEINVLFGPNSLAYGSDAIGGVVSYKTKVPKFSDSDKTNFKLNAMTRYSAANSEKTGHFNLNLGRKNWASFTSISFSDFGNLKTGSKRDSRFPDFGLRPNYVTTSADGSDTVVDNPNPNVQIGTEYHQYDLLQKFIFRPKSNFFLAANFQFSNTGNVPRYDNLQEIRNGTLRYAEWFYGPQQRALVSLQMKNYNPSNWYDQYILTTAVQSIHEDRIIRNFNSPSRIHQNENVIVSSMTIEFKKLLSKNYSILYGLDLQNNRVNSTAFSENIVTQEINTNALSRYADGENHYLTWGSYADLEYANASNPFSFKVGMRQSGSSFNIRYLPNQSIAWPQSFIDGIKGSTKSVTWSLSGLYKNPKGCYARMMFSTAFRSPNIDDLSKIRVNSNEITFPNPELLPEKSISGEVSVGIEKKNFKLNSTIFYTSLDDAIVRKNFTTPSGEDTYLNNGEILNVVGNTNAQSAYIYGMSINGDIQHKSISVESSINFTKGRERIANGFGTVPFSHIPPYYGNTSITYEKENWIIRFSQVYNGSKSIEEYGGSVDNPDLATTIGALSWTTSNVYLVYKATSQLELSLACENIWDKHYRPFASGISAPGRNIIISGRVSI